MSENIDKDVELSEDELRQAAGGRRTAQTDALGHGPIVLNPRDKKQRFEGELDGNVEIQR